MKRKIKSSGRLRSAASAPPTAITDTETRDRVAFLAELIRSRRRRSEGSAPKTERGFGDRLRRMLGMQEADVDEVIQDAAEALLRTREPIHSLPSFFMKTAENRKLRFLRVEKQARSFQPRLSAEIELHGSRFPAPDAETERRLAIRRLVKRVHPGRRAVAALGLAEHSATQIAATLKLPKNTAKSQWARAKEDIGGPAVVLALLASVWVWIVARGRQLAGAVSGSGRCGARTLVASAAIPLLVTGHSATAAPREPDVARDEQASTVEHAAGWAYTFSPMLATNAEREREWTATGRAAPAALSGNSRADMDDDVEARGILDQALTALHHGHLGVAEDALRLYDSERPDDPFASQRARIAAGLAAAKAP